MPSKININLPIFTVPDKALAAPTQQEIPVADITQNMALFKDGGAAIVLETTSLNFGLLSDREQEAVIAAYAALINSLSYSIQIVVRSERKDISSYLSYLAEAKKKISNPKLAALMLDYEKFISETIRKRDVLEKKFYIVIPFSQYELGIAKSAAAVTKKKGPLPFPKSYVVKKAKTVLIPKRDHIMRQARRLGLKLVQLTNEQLVELYYEVYNPKIQSRVTEEEQYGLA